MGTRIRQGAEEFITKWFHNPDSKKGKHSPKFQLICDEDGVLYSYGTHFPLAKFETKNGLPHLLVNMEHSTMTTNGHRDSLLGHVNKESPVCCEGSLDEPGAIHHHDVALAIHLKQLATCRDKKALASLFKYAYNPGELLFDESGSLACYIGVKAGKIHDKKELAKALLKHARPGSFSRKIASLLLHKNDSTWEPEDHTTTDDFLKALFNKKGYKEDKPSIKWLAHFHAVGAEVVAAQICSEDGGAAVRMISNSKEN